MPLWVAAVLFLLCVVGTVLSLRVYLRGGDPFFLSAGISLLAFSLVALTYVACVLLLVSAVK